MNLRRALILTGLYAALPPALRPAVAKPPVGAANAFLVFLKASSKLVQADAVLDMVTIVPKRVHKDSEKVALLRANAAALALARSGLNLPYAAPPQRSIAQKSPYYRQFRALAHLLTLDAEMRLAHGDAEGAIESCLDAIQLGQKIEEGDAVLARVVGITCQGIAQRRAWSIVDALSADAVKRAIRRLQAIYDHRTLFAETLREEKRVGRAYLDEVFARKDPAIPDLLHRFGSKQQIVALYDRYLDGLIARGAGRYGVTDGPGTRPPDNDPINPKAANQLWSFRFKVANIEQTQNALLLTTLALRAYRLEHRSLPPTLDALCPGYLRRVPEDEFAAQGPLRYRLNGPTGYALYSVGPDGVDDNGRPIDDTTRQTFVQRHLAEAGSKGDIVAGINF